MPEKRPPYALIDPHADVEKHREMYALMHRLIVDHHPSLNQARIALAWNMSWKPNVDGRLVLGKCKICTALERELAPYDAVIILLRDFWENPSVTDHQRRALLDHELTHVTTAEDPKTGEVKIDPSGRIKYRSRKHDVEEFASIVERHGVYKHDLEVFARALLRGEHTPPPPPPRAPGIRA